MATCTEVTFACDWCGSNTRGSACGTTRSTERGVCARLERITAKVAAAVANWRLEIMPMLPNSATDPTLGQRLPARNAAPRRDLRMSGEPDAAERARVANDLLQDPDPRAVA